ncbi:ralA-binding protein 1 isoform X2 [Centruroides vittatus]|uniref:ralA-binding protein 1 isoform X2 n=1 Tax=Centruroides vittatus TaxID=120091 RepID=UPI0035104C15
MDFESPDVEKDFPGLYASETAKNRSQERDSDYSDEEKVSRKELLIGKRRERKESKKDKGYVAFEGESSEDEMDETKSPAKTKKTKAPFKFPGKDKKERSGKTKDKELKETKKEEDKSSKESKKEHKKKKIKLSRFDKKDKKKKFDTKKSEEKPIFGVPLHTAVERNPCHDGVEIPAIVRECIDYIEEHGLACEGIYQISGVKSKVRQLKSQYNSGEKVYLYEHEPHIVASLLKHFLRELPEPVLTNELMPKFEDAAALKNEQRKVEIISKLIESLPKCNRLLLSYVFIHMLHIIQLEKRNKMNLQNISIVLSPTMQISHRVLHALFAHHKILFGDFEIKKYMPPIQPETSRLSLELPDTPAAIEEELGKQENLLNELHAELNAGLRDKQKEEQLWEIQRIVTQLKRKLRFLKQVQDKQVRSSVVNAEDDFHIDTRLQQVKEETSQEAVENNIEKNENVQEEIQNETVKSENIAPEKGTEEISQKEKCDEKETVPVQNIEKPEEVVKEEVKDDDVVEEVIIEEQAQKTVLTTVEKEELEKGEKVTTETKSENEEIAVVENGEDDEVHALLHEEKLLLLQQEELLFLGEELKRKIATEHSEVERLRAEIAEYQQFYKFKQYSFDSSEKSSETDSSEKDEEDLQQVLEDLIKENQALEKKNAEVTRQIQQEREACMMIKIQMKLLQQEGRHLEYNRN